jgi:DNA-directed RNA polymerase subunit K/omega
MAPFSGNRARSVFIHLQNLAALAIWKTDATFCGESAVMQNLRTDSLVNHPEVRPIDRKDVTLDERKTLQYYSKYEYTALLATRAQQLADGARPLVSLEGILPGDPLFVWKVAEKEILSQRLPFLVHRRMPDGKSEFWSTQELEKIW